jgi:UDP-N-acetyl-D-mannosaminuronic acid dehydrogenase
MINVIGLGYIGLPTALMFASKGIKVVGTDINEQHVKDLNEGRLYFEEKGLEELFASARENGIKFTNEYIKSGVYIVTVPTPYIEETKKVDMKYVVKAVNTILDICEKGTIIIIESTISPGSIDEHIRPAIQKRGFIIGEDIHLIHAPERILPGNMIYELEFNSRTVGADDEEIGYKVIDLYKSFCKAEIVLTDIKSAEMSKVVENTFRDINIAFANELAIICREAGLDVYEIIRIANKHPRVNILQPGPGVGGHCIPVDPWFLIGDYPNHTKLITSARKVNDRMPNYIYNRILEIMAEHNIDDFSKVGLYGLSYKQNVDDVRESPTLQLLNVIKENDQKTPHVYDPYIKNNIVDGQVQNIDKFIKNSEIIVIMISHSNLLNDLSNLDNKIVFDTRNSINVRGAYKL